MTDRAPIRGTGCPPVLSPYASRAGSPCRSGQARTAFSLTELLVVMAVIVAIIGIAIPVIGVLSGQQSIESAQNQLAAVLGQARGRALALQRETGLLFHIDPAGDRIAARVVDVVGRYDAPYQKVHQLDLVPQMDPHLLPGGVWMQFPVAASGGRTEYTGSVDAAGGTPILGAILFDKQGRLLIAPWWVQAEQGGAQTALGNLVGLSDNSLPADAQIPTSHLGMVLFERAPFQDRFGLDDGTGSDEEQEHQWIDENSRLLLINRYSGTFVE